MSGDVIADAGKTDTPGRPALTVGGILELPVVKRAVPEIVAGSDGIDQPVRWVHSAEAPYIAEMLKGGELLLTTGLGIGRSSLEQREYIAALKRSGVAGLAIELGRRFRSVPKPLADAADQRGLPLIVFHHEVRFVEITEAAHSEIVNRQLAALRRADSLHRQFFDLMLNGAGIPEVLTALAEMIHNPVVLEQSGHGVLYHAAPGTDDAAALAAWESFQRDLASGFETIEQPVPLGTDEQWGRLVVLGATTAVAETDRVALERAVGVLALALLRDREADLVASRERGNFLASLLEGDVHEAEVRSRAISMGFRGEPDALFPVVATRSRSIAHRIGEEAAWVSIWREVEKHLIEARIDFIAGTLHHERQLLLVVSPHEPRRSEIADDLALVLRRAASAHLGVSDAVLLCVGSTVSGWAALPEALRAAVDSVPAISHLPSKPWHDVADPDLDRLLWALADQPELRRFAQARLAPLVEHDERRAAHLLPTLIAFCEHGGRKAATARSLHIERQSLYHRLRRIEQVLGLDLADPEALLGLHLALRTRHYLPKAKS